MRSHHLLLSVVVAGQLIIPSAAFAAPSSPNFRDIEYRLTGNDALAEGQADVHNAIAIGSSLSDGVLVLRRAGATCKPDRHSDDTVRCLYNQMSSDGNGLLEVRWTTSLKNEEGRVTDVDVKREVDYRMTN